MPLGPQLTNLDGALADNELHVWHTSLELPQTVVDRLFELLDSEEQARSARFQVADARMQYVISHAFLRSLLGQYLRISTADISFRVSDKGKPELANRSNLRFNLSHTGGTAAIAVTRAGRVGVDVEQVRDNLDPLQLADRFFSPLECDWLRSQPDSLRLESFFSCWTAKESYIKACGGGLSMGLDGFALIPKAGNSQLQLEIFGEPQESRKWTVWQLNVKPGVCAAVAAEANDLLVRVGEWFPSL